MTDAWTIALSDARLISWLHWLCGDDDDAKQDTLIDLHTAAGLWDPARGSWRTYINRRRPVSRVRRTIREDPTPPEDMPAHSYTWDPADAERRWRVARAAQRLPPRQRLAFTQRWAGREYPEIGAALGVSAQRAAVICSDAISALREAA